MDEYNFLKQDIDLSSLGLIREEDFLSYFCTPKGAKIIYSTGVDGAHFCHLRNFGDMVFVVSPANSLGENVHVVAKSFEDFLSLVFTLKDAVLIEQAWELTEEDFNKIKNEIELDAQQEAALQKLNKMGIVQESNPYLYLRNINETFDYSKIEFDDEYYDLCDDMESRDLPPWSVCFEGGFYDEMEQGEEVIAFELKKQIDWQDLTAFIPSIYSCAKGLVIDICIQMEKEKIEYFISKWGLTKTSEDNDFSEEDLTLLTSENPLGISLSPSIILNGEKIERYTGCSLAWNPCFEDDNSIEAKGIIEHYDLDKDKGFVISRFSFPWKRTKAVKIETLDITLSADMVQTPIATFLGNPSDDIKFIHPKSQEEYTLAIHECESGELSQNAFPDENFEYPTQFITMSYSAFPALGEAEIYVRDICKGDSPREKKKSKNESYGEESRAAVGIIGGADGCTVIALNNDNVNIHSACSQLHFESDFTPLWQVLLNEKLYEDMTVKLI